MKHLFASASVLALTTSAAFAQTVLDLGEVVVFANQTETEARRVGASVEVLDEADIAASPTSTVAETLSRLPGVSTSTNGGPGKATSLRIRGLSDRYVSVRINGIDVTDPSSVQTQYNWGGLNRFGITGIEVLKGSQSAIYGSEAIAGVVNVTTFRPTENGTFFRYNFEVGSYDTVAGSFSVGTKTDRAMIALTVSRVDTDAFSAADENLGNTETDPFESTTVLLSARYAVSDQVTLGFEGIFEDQETNIDAGGGAGRDADRPFFTDRIGGRIYAEIEAGAFMHEFGIGYFETEREDRLTPFGSPTFEGQRTEANWTATTDLPAGPLTFGIEYSEEEAEFSNGTADYSIASIFAEHLIAINNDLDVTVSGRFDDHSEFGSEVTGRLAAAWRPNADTTVRSSIGTGYRAPSLNELFGPFNFSNPNPDLQPEESLSFDLSVERQFGNGAEISAGVFYTEIDNLIDYPVDNYVQVPGTSTSHGVELAGSVPLSNAVSLFGAYTYIDSERADGTRERRVPEHDVVLGLDAQFDSGWGGQFTVNHVAGRDDGFIPFSMPDYTVAHLQITYDLSENATAYLRVENVFDEEYETATGFGTSDRAVFVGVRGSF